MRILRHNSLTIERRTAGAGFLDDDGNYIEPSVSENINIRCSIQPFRNGDEQVELPEGVETDDAEFVYTQTLLLTNDEFTNQDADEALINGRRYECFRVENWSRYEFE